MRANERALLSACIDTGIYAGWIKAHKYNPEPHELRIQEEIDTAIWYEIDQYFVFDSERDLCDEVVEGFDQLEQDEVDRLRAKKKQIYEDLKDAVEQLDDASDYLTSVHDGSPIAEKQAAELMSASNALRKALEEKREWVGLTDDEVEEAVNFPWHYIPFARAIEAKLKEKNSE